MRLVPRDRAARAVRGDEGRSSRIEAGGSAGRARRDAVRLGAGAARGGMANRGGAFRSVRSSCHRRRRRRNEAGGGLDPRSLRGTPLVAARRALRRYPGLHDALDRGLFHSHERLHGRWAVAGERRLVAAFMDARSNLLDSRTPSAACQTDDALISARSTHYCHPFVTGTDRAPVRAVHPQTGDSSS